ncbi:glycosyltransferase family 4 protein [Flaviramulus sp. BrNp1-15]|uniref:glycosyltransferase family 4 protein n=1 Tax=Flaviramulus sp. BrNp1-15 TaxID=2916754 RepID=UPI001EE7FE14|nr:glycosyltransferase family 4 protein [Flaviramulus sp. BrNp1-15]ULC60579.1 glycosyltransferase family 4 protein [Flaviramulus sp. BrNp1-15]
MKIGFITSEYPHPQVSHAAGIATSIKNLAVTLVKKGIDVTVFVYHQNQSEVISDNGVEIHLIKKEKYKLLTWYFYRKYIQKYVNTVVKEKGISILEAPDWTGITAFMKFYVPLIIRFHGSDAYFCKLENRKQKFKNFLFEKLALKRAKAFIAPTTYAGIETRKIFGLDKNKIKTIHYGLQLENFANIKPEVYSHNVILYIGTVIRKKGVFELAEIFNKVIEVNPNAQLIMIGNDSPDVKTGAASTFELIESIFSKKALKQVNYLGKKPYTEVKQYINNAHVCVFPSFAETLGMVTIESMAMQKPVVNTSIGWAQEIIDDGMNGYLAHPSNIDLYSKRILNLLKNPDLCLQLGKAARQKVEVRFNIEKNADINIAYYKSVLKL